MSDCMSPEKTLSDSSSIKCIQLRYPLFPNFNRFRGKLRTKKA